MDCRRKKSRRKSDEIVFDVFHLLKRVDPMLDYYLATEPRYYGDLIEHTEKIKALMAEIAKKELLLLSEDYNAT